MRHALVTGPQATFFLFKGKATTGILTLKRLSLGVVRFMQQKHFG